MNEARIRLSYTTFLTHKLKQKNEEFEFSNHTIQVNEAES